MENKFNSLLKSSVLMIFVFIIGNFALFSVQNPFPDIPSGHWAYNAVIDLYNKGIIKGFYNEPVFSGQKKLSRYDMAVMISRTLEYLNKNNKMNSLSRDDLKKIEKLLIEFSDEIGKLGLTNIDIKKELANIDNRLTTVEKNQSVLKKTVVKIEKEKKENRNKLRPLDVILIIATGVLIGKVF